MNATTTPTGSPIIERIRKLLRLAANAGNEHEAASAADRAQALMARHEIQEAELRLGEPSLLSTPTEPIDTIEATSTKKRVAWHSTLAWPVSKQFNCRFYYTHGSIRFFGRLTNIQAASYTLQFLIREVDRLCEQHCDGEKFYCEPSPSRKYRNAFRIGCAHRVASRLTDVRVEASVGPVGPVTEDTAPTPSPSAGALMVIQHDRAAVNDAYAAFSQRFKTATPIGNYSSGDGYRAGQTAGNSANIGGGGGRGLPAGRGVLK